MKTPKVAKPTKSKSISFSIDKDQYEKFRRLQNEAKDMGIRLTPKKSFLVRLRCKGIS